jgi:hypothetical protein
LLWIQKIQICPRSLLVIIDIKLQQAVAAVKVFQCFLTDWFHELLNFLKSAALVSVYLDELNTWVQAEPNALVKKLLANTLQYAHTIILDSTIRCKCFNKLLRHVHLFVLSHLISRKQEVSMNMLLGIPTMGITSTFAILSFFMDVLVKLHSKQDSVENRDTPLKLLSVIVGSIV